MGLIAFAGVAQFLPSLLGGLYWHHASKSGAVAGLLAGVLVWAYTLLLPSFEGGTIPASLFREGRSEEHTSELQSLMRISYAVFCLKKKQKCRSPSRLQTTRPIHTLTRYEEQTTQLKSLMRNSYDD